MIDTGLYIYQKYIMKIVDRYECGIIEKEKASQLLDTLQKWEDGYNNMSGAKKEDFRFALRQLTY